MKLHKIPNVPIEECSAEQKIAYNLAWSNYDWIARDKPFDSYEAAAQHLVRVRWLEAGYNSRRRYNDTAILAALTAGLEAYCNAPYHIMASYREIGQMFPVPC